MKESFTYNIGRIINFLILIFQTIGNAAGYSQVYTGFFFDKEKGGIRLYTYRMYKGKKIPFQASTNFIKIYDLERALSKYKEESE